MTKCLDKVYGINLMGSLAFEHNTQRQCHVTRTTIMADELKAMRYENV